MTNNLLVPIQELYRMFEYFNNNLYNGELKTPIITIASKRNALGWCTVSKVWTNETEKYYEIGITAEFLNRSYEETANTLMHDMVHLYNLQIDIKDCSGQKHNKRFKKEAERRYFTVEKSDKYGWAHTVLTDTLVNLVNSFDRNVDAFGIYRLPAEPKEKTTNKSVKYVCPSCEAKVQSKDELSIICKECNMEFVIKGGAA